MLDWLVGGGPENTASCPEILKLSYLEILRNPLRLYQTLSISFRFSARFLICLSNCMNRTG